MHISPEGLDYRMENNDSQHPRKHFGIMKKIPICIWLNVRIFKSFSLKAKRKWSVWEKPVMCWLWARPRSIKGVLGAKTSKSQSFLSSQSQGYRGSPREKLEQILWSFWGYQPPYKQSSLLQWASQNFSSICWNLWLCLSYSLKTCLDLTPWAFISLSFPA